MPAWRRCHPIKVDAVIALAYFGLSLRGGWAALHVWRLVGHPPRYSNNPGMAFIIRVMREYQLAQLNIGVIKGAMDSPVMADFAANLDRINALAESMPGFVWRLQTEDGDATSIRPFDDENMLVNMSVWQDVKALNDYVYRSAHVELMRRRKEWFERMDQAFLVLWWVPTGHRPTVAEAMVRLELLREKGPTSEAFTFRQPFPAPEVTRGPADAPFEDECPAA